MTYTSNAASPASASRPVLFRPSYGPFSTSAPNQTSILYIQLPPTCLKVDSRTFDLMPLWVHLGNPVALHERNGIYDVEWMGRCWRRGHSIEGSDTSLKREEWTEGILGNREKISAALCQLIQFSVPQSCPGQAIVRDTEERNKATLPYRWGSSPGIRLLRPYHWSQVPNVIEILDHVITVNCRVWDLSLSVLLFTSGRRDACSETHTPRAQAEKAHTIFSTLL